MLVLEGQSHLFGQIARAIANEKSHAWLPLASAAKSEHFPQLTAQPDLMDKADGAADAVKIFINNANVFSDGISTILSESCKRSKTALQQSRHTN